MTLGQIVFSALGLSNITAANLINNRTTISIYHLCNARCALKAAIIHGMKTTFFSDLFSLKQRKMYLNSSRDSSCSSDLQIDLSPPVSFFLLILSDCLFMYIRTVWVRLVPWCLSTCPIQCCGSGSGLDPDSWSPDPDPDSKSGSGSRRANITHKTLEKVNTHFL